MHSLYIHVPFCQKRCFYCSFYSTTCGKRERDAYVAALIDEMHERRTDQIITTVYFGGGTPSQLDADELRAIFDAIRRNFTIAPDAEITFECNPDDVCPVSPKTSASEGVGRSRSQTDDEHPTLPSLLASLGVNRVSLGVQTFSDELLERINRRHTAEQAVRAVMAVHDAGIHNVSIDLIYGLPGQTFERWKKDVDEALRLAGTTYDEDCRTSFDTPAVIDEEPKAGACRQHPLVAHISSYCLSIEEGTHLYNLRARGEIAEADDDITLQMYDYLVDSLTKAGFEHYEISNFARSGFHSRHNTSYWTRIPYIGLGPSAHSYDGLSTRRWNDADLQTYCASPLTAYEEEHLSENELYDELIMTRLRTADGLPLDLLSEEQHSYLLRQAQQYVSSGHLALIAGTAPGDSFLRLTRKGIFISDTIFSDLMCEM